MNYLLINHIQANRGKDAAHIRLPAAWARDLAAAGRAARASNVSLIVATPITNVPIAGETIEMVPDAFGFEHAVIPSYDSARSFLAERSQLSGVLAPLIATADIVQLDHGGHPIPLGLVAAPITRDADKPTLWIVSGDQLPTSRLARSAGTLAKRALARPIDSRVRHSLIDALQDASAVITTHPAVADTLRVEHKVQATTVESIDVNDTDLLNPDAMNAKTNRLLDTTRPLRLAILGQQVIDRGTDHVLAAMHRCWRLRMPVELVIDATGGEATAVLKHADELGLSLALIHAKSQADFDNADVLVDVALANRVRTDLDVPLARGLAPIAYLPRRRLPGIVALERGDVDGLAEAIFQAASNRQQLAARMTQGVEWCRNHTLDAAYRQRFQLAQSLLSSFTAH